MVQADTTTDNSFLRGLVDIGSNGVRFSISSLHPSTARIMPTIFQDRAPISLYDAQFTGTTKSPISEDVISAILVSMRRFATVCADFNVPPANIRVVATEATREAQNSQDFRDRIHAATGWTVELLTKEDEGRIGAEGVASSFNEVSGLVMDLGGGSTQLTWMVSKGGKTRMPPAAVSLPYGAAALTKRRETAINDEAIAQLKDEIKSRVATAITGLDIPPELSDYAADDGGYTLYLSGGGFRGFGFLLLDQHPIQPYPVPIINGFKAPGSAFSDLADFHLSSETTRRLDDKFRISDRRARQVPAVAFLISALVETLPTIKTVIFCQGGVREGALYERLDTATRAQDPLVVATSAHAPRDTAKIRELLNYALPRSTPYIFRSEIVPALANMLIYHSNIPKESRPSCGLHATTTGILASAHGLTHETRALLALALCERWGGEVSDSNLKTQLEDLVGPEFAYWARYCGAVAGVVGDVYPAGIVGDVERLRFFAYDEGAVVVLKVRTRGGDERAEAVMVARGIEGLGKVGKKKKCREGYRRKVALIWGRDLE
ncbi:uncharacterized protein LAJ45_00175 [Morchella importuna]|uniref:uncharacterized protein n=1 Tax=Morchella importuna TaxID=1174673 RepID=UPI001E8E494C|nr:uncharacterized protein LAJ45_00175 [Morchella importuna]KAH8155166.1 hypothetical protein LAJ45_00175 [Morchella importuna]